MTKKKSKCKYCEVEVPFGCIRCYKCDSAWQEGRTQGIEEVTQDISSTAVKLLRLLGFRNKT